MDYLFSFSVRLPPRTKTSLSALVSPYILNSPGKNRAPNPNRSIYMYTASFDPWLSFRDAPFCRPTRVCDSIKLMETPRIFSHSTLAETRTAASPKLWAEKSTHRAVLIKMFRRYPPVAVIYPINVFRLKATVFFLLALLRARNIPYQLSLA